MYSRVITFVDLGSSKGLSIAKFMVEMQMNTRIIQSNNQKETMLLQNFLIKFSGLKTNRDIPLISFVFTFFSCFLYTDRCNSR